jgi:hypothetical protein
VEGKRGVKGKRGKTKQKPNIMKFVQINLHHSKAAMAVACRQHTAGMADVAFIQKPWFC